MVAGRHTEVSVSPVSINRLWKAAGDASNLLPKILPQVVESIQILQGDGGVGTVKQFNFSGAKKDLGSIKDKVLVLDPKSHVYKYTVVEGGEMAKGRLKSSTFEIKMEPAGEGGTKTSLTWEYDTLGDNSVTPEEAAQIVTGVLGMNKAIEAHLIANPDAYV